MDSMSAPAASESKRILIFVAFIVFIDMVGIGLILPVMPALLEQITGESVDRTAEIGGLLIFAYAIMQFLFAPIIGGLSDRFGRRPVLLCTLMMLGIDYLILALAPDLWWLFVGRLLSGIMGASWAAANSCVADVASAQERGKYFGILGGAGASGFVIGPAIGGLLGGIDTRLPFYAAALMALIGAAIGWFILKETLPPEKRRQFTLARANPLGTLFQMAKTPVVLRFLTVIFLLQLAAQSQVAVWAYFNRLQFGWSELQIGLSVALFGALLALAQGGLTGPVIQRIGAVRCGLAGMLFIVPAYLCFAFASEGWMMIAGIIIGGGGGLAFPAMQQLMSERISEDAQGELQGAVASVIGITTIIGPVAMTSLFGAFADRQGLFFPGAPYLLAALLTGVAFLPYWSARRAMATPPPRR
jgi:DHA1 family tetracycline resistance protein-like MFS transporter